MMFCMAGATSERKRPAESAHRISKLGVPRYVRTAVKFRAGRYRLKPKAGMVSWKSNLWFCRVPITPWLVPSSAGAAGARNHMDLTS